MGDLQLKGCDIEEDRMSQLPDDVLISIISRLTFREATATSILSPRWQSLYTYYTRLDFPPFKPEPCPLALRYLEKIPKKMFSNYISMINRFLVSHKAAGRIEEFRVRMPCLKGADIQRWLEFALSRKVEILEISMRHSFDDSFPRHRYSFGLSKVSSCVLVGLRCLKDLSLSAVHVDDEAVETLLSNSPLLESLSIEFCDTLTKVSVVGSPLFLKHLGLSFCHRLQSIEIRDMMELLSLRCYRNNLPDKHVVRLSNVPKLVELDTSDDYRCTLAQILPTIPPGILDQLQLLKLWTNLSSSRRNWSPTYTIPELINVKHVEVQVVLEMGTDSNAFSLLPLLKACRSLEELHVKFSGQTLHDGNSARLRLVMANVFPKLRKLKLSAYSGTQTELKFALVILSCTDALQELVVQPISTSNEMRQLAERHFPTTVLKYLKAVIISTTNT